MSIKCFKRACPVCNSKKSEMLFVQKFANIEGVSFLTGYDVVSCNDCGFIYASNIPSQEIFDEYYINANKYEIEIEQPDTFTGKYDHIIQEIMNLNENKNISIADVGCARSEVLRKLKESGYSDLTGIDPSVKSVEYLMSKGIKGIQATVDNILTNNKQQTTNNKQQTTNNKQQYDVVCFLWYWNTYKI
ncbi:hypothetical protein FACS1894102_0480 [Spirochaetia bacterium]|nr:hypothetical protein FACS1894102_0480 [Spirochaetia bacterium]